MSENETKKVVWILGAGFSRSLGGPLFETLFGPWLMAHLEAHFPQNEFPHLYGNASNIAHWLYNFGRQFSLGRADGPPAWHPRVLGQRLWDDAEQYLQILDGAAWNAQSPWAKRITSIVPGHPFLRGHHLRSRALLK